MKTAYLLTVGLLAVTVAARADFSYTTTRKTTGGAMASVAGAAGNQTSKNYFKGQKMKVDTGDIGMILDFDAQTITTINNRQKTVSVRSFSDMNSAIRQSDVNAKVDVRETGQKKTVNGYNASELIMTMDVSSPAAAQMGNMKVEVDMWMSPDVPGAGELRAFYQKNMSRFPWAAMGGGGGNQSVQTAMAEMQRRMAEMNGVQILQVVKMKSAGAGGGAPAGAPAMPQVSAAQSAQMQAAMARLQQMQSQGGPAAAAAAQALARMGASAPGGAAAPGGASDSLMEITAESGDFSTASVPDSVFAIPTGYQKADPK